MKTKYGDDEWRKVDGDFAQQSSSSLKTEKTK